MRRQYRKDKLPLLVHALALSLILATLVLPSTAAAWMPDRGAWFTVGSRTYGIWIGDRWIYFNMDVAPCIRGGRIYLPARYVAHALALGGTVGFCNGTVIIREGNRRVLMAIGNKALTVNNTVFIMDAAPFIKDGRTMIPLRFAAEAFGATVDWDPASRSAYVYR